MSDFFGPLFNPTFVRAPQRITFDYSGDHVEIKGEADSLQDLSSVLQQILVEVEQQLSAQAKRAE